MNIGVIGSGYVGLVTAACFAEMGNTVVCVDNDPEKIARLNAAEVPIHEPGLDDLVASNQREKRLRFTTSLGEAVAISDVYFIAVGTPPNEDGSADLQHILNAARALGQSITRACTVVNKSTVPVGTADRLQKTIRGELDRRGLGIDFDMVSNPEFLKEGDAVADFMRPDRVVIGATSERAVETMRKLYAPFTRSYERMLVMGLRDAEMTKYAANAMLAAKISFMNEVAALCERLDVDVENVRKGIGSDSRIGYSFIYPGCGYGGSCFPKDMKALIHIARSFDFDPLILHAVEMRNARQKLRLFEKIVQRFGADLSGATFGIWGLAFKPGTDDMREAPSEVLLKNLIASGARVLAYDPEAMDVARRTLPRTWLDEGRLTLTEHQYDALVGVVALGLVTVWKPFRYPDSALMKKSMKRPVIFDGRNQYDPKELRGLGFEYFGIGRQ
jgi:UDPglucose 6-dehydrogenase